MDENDKLSQEFFQLSRINNIPIYLHWSFLISILVIFIVTRFDGLKTIYYGVGYSLIVLSHTLGHLLAAKFFGIKVLAIDVSAMSGRCRITSTSQLMKDLVFYSSGLLAQIALFVVAVTIINLTALSDSPFGSCLYRSFTWINTGIFTINLFLRSGPDGRLTEGRALVKFLSLSWKIRKLDARINSVISPVFSPDTRLLSREGFKPDNFTVGIEILNDNTTPMDFVVEMLINVLDLDASKALDAMAEIHVNGGKLFSMPNEKAAVKAVQLINDAVQKNHHQLICRVARLDALNEPNQ